MYGKDIEKILSLINEVKDVTNEQIHLLARESDYRLAMIKHTHNVHVVSFTGDDGENSGSFDRVPSGTNQTGIFASSHPDTGHQHSIPTHKHKVDIALTGDSPTNKGSGPEDSYSARDGKTNQVSDQRTYKKDSDNDKHEHHKHIKEDIIYEEEHPLSANTYIQPILNIFDNGLQEEIDKLKQIQDNMYTDITTFNNGYGSPWTEIYDLKSKVDLVKQYGDDYPDMQWIGEKHALLNLMQSVTHITIDAKWALINYHDWIQRGYDNMFNDNIPSISWDDFEKGQTIGNIDQEFDENVRKPTPNNDPF